MTHSLRNSIISRKRRSAAYSPDQPSITSAPPLNDQFSSSPSRHADGDETSPRTGFRPSVPAPLISESEMQSPLCASLPDAPFFNYSPSPADASAHPAPPQPQPARPGRASSTVSYLQVQRPATILFGDEVRLRKDQYGTYHIVEEGDGGVQAGHSGEGSTGMHRGTSWLDGGGEWGISLLLLLFRRRIYQHVYLHTVKVGFWGVTEEGLVIRHVWALAFGKLKVLCEGRKKCGTVVWQFASRQGFGRECCFATLGLGRSRVSPVLRPFRSYRLHWSREDLPDNFFFFSCLLYGLVRILRFSLKLGWLDERWRRGVFRVLSVEQWTI